MYDTINCIEYSYLVLDTIYFARSKFCPSEEEQALRTNSFTPFLTMTERSHLILIIYSITIYTPPTEITTLKDKAIVLRQQ